MADGSGIYSRGSRGESERLIWGSWLTSSGTREHESIPLSSLVLWSLSVALTRATRVRVGDARSPSPLSSSLSPFPCLPSYLSTCRSRHRNLASPFTMLLACACKINAGNSSGPAQRDRQRDRLCVCACVKTAAAAAAASLSRVSRSVVQPLTLARSPLVDGDRTLITDVIESSATHSSAATAATATATHTHISLSQSIRSGTRVSNTSSTSSWGK